MLEMTTREFLVLQLAMDGVLALLVLFLLWQVRRALGRPAAFPGAKEMQELRKLVEDSRTATDHFLAAVQESRGALRDLAQALDEREIRIRGLLARCPEDSERPEPETASSPSPPGESRAAQVLALAGRGLSERDIARRTGIPDGEVRLILNLSETR